MPKLIQSKILANKEIADKIYEMRLEGSFQDYEPGSFIHIKCSSGLDPLLRRPISICNVDSDSLSIIYRASGSGTQLLASKNIGEEIDFLGPLGRGFDLDAPKASQTVLLIGGGVGVPPLYYLGRKLQTKGLIIKSLLGFNAPKDVFYEQQFSSLGELKISTLSPSSHYQQGYVTDLLDSVGHWDLLYSCGPTAMLKTLQNSIPKEAHAYMSLEERMGCGIGACLACVCDTTGGYARVCKEGPVFHLHEVRLACYN